jgi:serine/threonine protein phosphatase PrpC
MPVLLARQLDGEQPEEGSGGSSQLQAGGAAGPPLQAFPPKPEPAEALASTFLQADAALRSSDINVAYSGSTAVLCLLQVWGSRGAGNGTDCCWLVATWSTPGPHIGRSVPFPPCHACFTATCTCLSQGRRLTTAWVGDSRAVLARQVR